MRFSVTLANQTHNFDLRRDAQGTLTVLADGRPCPLRVYATAEGIVCVAPDGSVTDVATDRFRDTDELLIRGVSQRIRVASGYQTSASQLRRSNASANQALEIRAPMPGRVVAMKIQAGEPLERGQSVAILEAMKMENEIFSETSGLVARVVTQAGDVVETGAVLVQLQASA